MKKDSKTGTEVGTAQFRRNICDETGKVSYLTKHEARSSLISSKSVRIYQCPHNKGHFHLTKDWAHKRQIT
jgi:hypothetical protein